MKIQQIKVMKNSVNICKTSKHFLRQNNVVKSSVTSSIKMESQRKYAIEDDVQILKAILKNKSKPSTSKDLDRISHGFDYKQLSTRVNKPSRSLAMRFGKFIKPVIQAYLSGEDIEDTVTKLNQFIIDNKIEVYKDYDYAKVFPPFSNQFLYHVINIHETDWKKTEPLWVVLKNRLESGKKYTKNRYLSEELKKILETEFETFKGYKRK